MELYSLTMLSKDWQFVDDNDPGIDDFEVFTSVDKAKQYAQAIEVEAWADLNARPAQCHDLAWTDTHQGHGAECTTAYDENFSGYAFVIEPLRIDPNPFDRMQGDLSNDDQR